MHVQQRQRTHTARRYIGSSSVWFGPLSHFVFVWHSATHKNTAFAIVCGSDLMFGKYTTFSRYMNMVWWCECHSIYRGSIPYISLFHLAAVANAALHDAGILSYCCADALRFRRHIVNVFGYYDDASATFKSRIELTNACPKYPFVGRCRKLAKPFCQTEILLSILVHAATFVIHTWCGGNPI